MRRKAIKIPGWLTLTIGFAESFAPKSPPSVTNQFSVENRYGYIRENSENEGGSSSIKSQKEKLIGQGVTEENILVEVGPDPGSVSASKASKILPKFTKLVEKVLKDGDLLVVTSIDRCSYSAQDFFQLNKNFFDVGVSLVCLELPGSTDPEANPLLAECFAAVATLLQGRVKEKARKTGRKRGRKSVITKQLIEKVRHLKEDKMLSITDIGKLTGKSRNTIYKVLQNKLGYVSKRALVNPNDNSE